MSVNNHGQDASALEAFVRVKAILGQLDKYGLNGLDWDALAMALAQAKELGCASEEDLASVQEKSFNRKRLLEIFECVDAKWTGGAGRPYKQAARTGGED